MSVSLVDAGPIAQGLFTLVDSLFTSDDERLAAKFKIMKLEAQGALAQVNLNGKEAEHGSVFVAGWRPFIGWTCGAAFAWAFVGQPFVQFAIVAAGIDLNVASLPVLDLSLMMPVLLGMLGLGGLRTAEKIQGVARESVDRRAKG